MDATNQAAGRRRMGRAQVAGMIAGGGLLLAVTAAVLATRMSGAEPDRSPSSVPAPAQLPVVAKPPPTQPEVGLRTDTHLDKTPVRQTVGLDLVRNGWTYSCMECHKLFPARWHYDRPLVEHKNIQLQHGENRFCLNCHHPTNRAAFVDYDGSEIAEADVVLLCAKCHGPTHRDWKAGVHGRQNGHWSAALGERTKLRCIQCHDPHFPKFQPLKPLGPLNYPARAASPPDHSAGGRGKPPAHP